MRSLRARHSSAGPRSRLPRALIAGVVNVTPDSFSDGGNFFDPDRAVKRAEELLDQGADAVELGGESSRPGAAPVTPEEEIRRVLPVIGELRIRRPDARICVDTVHAETAKLALASGATMLNDVSALRLDPAMAGVAADAGCTLVLMHSRGGIGDMARYDRAVYADGGVVDAVMRELQSSVTIALSAGVSGDRIVLDPGLGFSKRPEHSVEILAHLPRLVELGFPVMVGASRKRFIGEITGVKHASDRDAGTIGANVVALSLGASWFRVHDVASHRHALDAAAAILEARA